MLDNELRKRRREYLCARSKLMTIDKRDDRCRYFQFLIRQLKNYITVTFESPRITQHSRKNCQICSLRTENGNFCSISAGMRLKRARGNNYVFFRSESEVDLQAENKGYTFSLNKNKIIKYKRLTFILLIIL